MARRTIKVDPGEVNLLRAMLDEREQLLQRITGAASMACVRNGIPDAIFLGITGDDELTLEVPGDEQPDSTGTATAGAAVVGDISPAPTGESASESTPAGKNGHSKPVVDAPDAGIPAGDGSTTSRGAFHHTEGA